MTKFFARLFAFSLGLAMASPVLLSSSAHAASIVARTVPELTELSDLVVEAEVVERESFVEQSGRIMTRTTLQVARYLKGEGPERLEVMQVGGEAGGRVMTLHGDFAFAVGQHLVLFTQRNEGALWPTLLGWSAFEVQGEGPGAPVLRPHSDLALHRHDPTGRLERVDASSVPAPSTLGDLAAEILAAAGRQR